MATDFNYIQFVCEQIRNFDNVRYRKMFGEYMIYVNDKPILLICDNIVYVKKLEEIKEDMMNAALGFPYKGAKEHFILDMDDVEFSNKVIATLESITPLPKKKSKGKS